MTLIDKIYIVIRNDTDGTIRYVESVWNTKELADSAKYFHAQDAMESVGYYSVITREINKAKLINRDE